MASWMSLVNYVELKAGAGGTAGAAARRQQEEELGGSARWGEQLLIVEVGSEQSCGYVLSCCGCMLLLCR